tara:strand:+ start:771 stop:941 length:171 start_codon:yes stop_codon:yes gene_type:complete
LDWIFEEGGGTYTVRVERKSDDQVVADEYYFVRPTISREANDDGAYVWRLLSVDVK